VKSLLVTTSSRDVAILGARLARVLGSNFGCMWRDGGEGRRDGSMVLSDGIHGRREDHGNNGRLSALIERCGMSKRFSFYAATFFAVILVS
jgi:hypothetical protein